jgi:hypothetical protein
MHQPILVSAIINLFRKENFQMTNGKSDMKGPLKGLISIIVIIAAVAFLFWYFKGGDDPAKPRDLKVLAIDVETAKAVPAVKKIGETFPLKNSNGNPVLWEAFKCPDCQVIYPATPKQMFTPCPVCGNTKVGSAKIEDENLPVKMPAKLPDISE